PPSLEVKAVRDLYRKRYGMVKGDEYSYEYPAVNRILQAAGRSIRSETDRAAIIMLEERMAQPKYLKYLPEEMRPDSTSSIERMMGKFF
ncbi:MAG: ATP-dependent DNA helicase, partial [Thermoplasmata archaeon]|nr:ATP-dependent DNA helicase [Thermoplasmata archaeon]